MGLKFKIDGKEQETQHNNKSHNPNNWDPKSYKETYPDRPMGVSGKSVNSDVEIQMTPDMTERLWEVINENTELKQQLYMAEHRLEQIKRILAE
jgi:hypothetical protein